MRNMKTVQFDCVLSIAHEGCMYVYVLYVLERKLAKTAKVNL